MMKTWGAVVTLIGLVWALIAFNMSTTVHMDGKTIGSGEYSTYIEPSEVYNLSMSNNRNINLIASGVLTLVGVIIFGFGSIQSPESTQTSTKRKCPFCAESIQAEAIVCKHCRGDLSSIPKNPENLSEVELNKLIEKLKLK